MKKQHWLIVLCMLLMVTFTACAHEHSYDKWEIEREATCQKTGLKIRQCDCGDEQTEKIPKLDHKYGDWQVKTVATCTTEGTRERTCEECGDVEEETITKTAENAYTATQLYDLYLNSVGEIVTYDQRGQSLSLGSCFVQTADGKLVTNYHVIENAYSAKVTLGGKTYDIEKVLAYDKNIDAAVLQITASDLTPVTVCELEHKVGETVYAFGSSKGLTATFSDGMITHAKREDSGVTYVQHSAPISGGNSGGPLINACGEVIGINTLTMKDSQNLNFAVCIAELKNLDYSNEMTMRQFYDAENNPYNKLVNLVVTKGSYSDESYGLTLKEGYSTAFRANCELFAMYFPDDGELWVFFCVDGNGGEEYVYFILDEDASGVYEWGYFDENDYEMEGTLYASTFTSNTLLGYSYDNLPTASLRNSARERASNMMTMICNNLTSGLTGIGVTAADLGFANF